jgi:hypothetical protein
LFVLGHVGIGTRLIPGLRQRVPARWLIVGCLLPDLIDKPLFYGLLWAEGHPDLLISGSRSIGHSGLLLVALLALSLATRRPAAWALCAGLATHLVLDIGGELLADATPESSIWLAISFPLLGWRFPKARFSDVLEHLRLSAESLYVVGGEIVGGTILLHAWWSRRRGQSS